MTSKPKAKAKAPQAKAPQAKAPQASESQQPKALTSVAARLRTAALTYPETYEESPWGDRVVKVKGKIFFFCGVREGELCLSAKLPHSNKTALALPFVEPTAYGLGKSGWVSARLAKDPTASVARFIKWIDESYRALAPAKLVSSLSEPAVPAKGAAKPAPTKLKPQPATNPKPTPAANPKPTPATNPKPKPADETKAKPLRKRALLLCQDPLRTERAQTAFAAKGLTLDATTDVAEVRRRLSQLDAVLIDLGRRQEDGFTLATEIDRSDFAISIFLVGLRDASARRRAKDLASADLFTDAPGDPEVVAAIVAAIAAVR